MMQNEHHLLEFDSTNGTVELLKMRAPAAREETVSSSDNRVETHGTFMMSEDRRELFALRWAIRRAST